MLITSYEQKFSHRGNFQYLSLQDISNDKSLNFSTNKAFLTTTNLNYRDPDTFSTLTLTEQTVLRQERKIHIHEQYIPS